MTEDEFNITIARTVLSNITKELVRYGLTRQDIRDVTDKASIEQMLILTHGNKTQAANRLGFSRGTFHKRTKELLI